MTERENLEQAIGALETIRATLGDRVVDTALLPLRRRLFELQAEEQGEVKQRKLITILFADVSGFTAMSEAMDPEDVSETINMMWTRLDTVIAAQDGVIDKHMGDALMALFGTPVGREDDPERAIRAGLALHKELESFVEEQMARRRPGVDFKRLQMRVGINTGLVLLDTIQSTGEYTALGDAVNLASRLEHAAPLGGVLVSHNSYQHVRGLFDVQELEPISVKGKSEPIQTYLVQGIRPRSFRVPTRGVVGIETPTIGREAEIQQLQDLYRTAMQTAQVVTVVADAGTGKSRLLYEFSNWMDVQPERLELFRGRSTEDMINLPYSLIRDIFSFRFEIQEIDRAANARTKLEQGIAEIVGPEAEAMVPFIGYLLGFDYSSSPYLQGYLADARQLRERAFRLFVQLLRTVAQRAPVVIFLEDLHWADDGSLDLLEYTVRECRDLPLLVVVLSRATLFERRPSWGGDASVYARIDLKPLSHDDCKRLVGAILRKVPVIPDEISELVVNRAEGNPYYIEEVIKMLIEDGVIGTGQNEWLVHMDRLAEMRVPQTLTGVIQARLDGLPVGERRMLQRASIVGRVFWDEVISHLKEVDEEPVDAEPVMAEMGRALSLLQGRELVFRQSTSAFAQAREYIFKHAILRDVTYESVLKQLRRKYHLQVATWLEERALDRTGELAGRIGEHYERAFDMLRAAEWYARAGKQAQNTFAPAAALDYYHRALRLWQETVEPLEVYVDSMIEVYKGQGEVYNWLGQFSEAVVAFSSMLDVARTVDDRLAQVQAWYGTAGARMYQGDLPAALESTTRAEELARAIDAKYELAKALSMKGWALFRFGDPDAAQALGEQALELGKELGNQEQIASSLNFLGGLHFMLGRYEPATRNLEEALEIFQQMDRRDKALPVLNNLGVIAEALGDYPRAFGRYFEAVNISREIGKRNLEMQYLTNLGTARVRLHDFVAAEYDLLQAIGMAQNAGLGMLSETYRVLAEAYLGQDKADDALAAARHAMALGRQFEARDNIAGAWRVLGLVAAYINNRIWLGDSEDTATYSASECFANGLEIFSEIGMQGERARALRAWARYELERGDREAGKRMWREAREIFERLGAQLEAERMAELPARKK